MAVKLWAFVFSAAFLSRAALAQSDVWAQCGGIGWSGARPTACVSGSSCVNENAYYSQCQTGTPAAPTTSVAAPAPTSTSVPSGSGISSIPASTLQELTNFGTNPNNVGMFVYRPETLATNPALVVASHECTATAQIYFNQTRFAQLAETYGYIVLFPSSPHSGTCWDVSSTETLTHNGGSDSLGIVSAVRYAIANWGVDASRVFAAGTSSGAMMTSVLAGAYPDVFAAGVVDSGVAYGCFALPGQPDDSWNSQCSTGTLIKTGEEWASQVKSAFPGFTGQYPKMQVWHGTADTALYPQNFYEEIKQWTTIFGYPATPISNVSESYLPAGYSNATYGPRFQAVLAQGVGHTVPVFEQQYLEFFGLA